VKEQHDDALAEIEALQARIAELEAAAAERSCEGCKWLHGDPNEDPCAIYAFAMSDGVIDRSGWFSCSLWTSK